jgi:hypothetical protein
MRFDSQPPQLWVNMARSRLQSGIAEAARRQGIQLTFVDRDHIPDIAREKDYQKIDIVEPPKASVRKVKVLDVDAKIYGTIDVDIQFETGSRKTIQDIYIGSAWHDCFGWHGYISPHVGVEGRQKIRRIITINAGFRMEDGKTGEIYAQHQSALQPIDTARPHVFFGSDKHPIDLKEPDEQIVMGFIHQEVDRFVAKLVPVETPVDVMVVSSKHDDCIRGVQALGGGDYATARAAFDKALNRYKDDHQARFGAGVACEASGDMTKAAEYYRLAIERTAGKPAPEYHAALDRLNRRAGRVP